MPKNWKIVLISSVTLLLVASLIVVALLLTDSGNNATDLDKLNIFPISVGEKTFLVSVLSNYSSSPEVSYWEGGKVVYVDFIGDPENSFFNVTIPMDLISGHLSLIDKYYKVSDEYYIQSYNGTHNSIYFNFDHVAYVKHFEIRETEDATTDSN